MVRAGFSHLLQGIFSLLITYSALPGHAKNCSHGKAPILKARSPLQSGTFCKDESTQNALCTHVRCRLCSVRLNQSVKRANLLLQLYTRVYFLQRKFIFFSFILYLFFAKKSGLQQ